MSFPAAIKSENKGHITVFYLSGEIDLYTSPAIREELNKAIDGMEFQKAIPTTVRRTSCRTETSQGTQRVLSSPTLLADEVSCRKRKNILISFKGVSYIDSSGLATLVELYQRTKKWNGDIILVDMEDSVKGVFELSRLDKIFTILPTIEEGIASFSK